MQPEIIPVILAGGEGRRLRPLTGKNRPKPFLRPFSEHSLLQESLRRVQPFADPVIVCAQDHADRALAEAGAAGRCPRMILAEPCMRSTAAAIAAAAFLLCRENAVMLVMPSDHYIEQAQIFQSDICRAVSRAQEEFVILGARPDSPATRYGYVLGDYAEDGYLKLRRFTEKPDPPEAECLLRLGAFWNTGIFMCRPAQFLAQLAVYAPEVHKAVGQAVSAAEASGRFIHPKAHFYSESPAVSVDYAVMENLQSGYVLPLRTRWHDIGCWNALLSVKLKASVGSFLKTA